MASTYTDIGTELMTTGENAGNWGTKTNTNLQILEEALRGYVSQSIAGGTQTTALTYTDGTVGDAARNMVIALTGTITGNQTVTVPAVEKMWIIDNQTSGAYTVNIKVSGQTGVTWGASDKGTKILYGNGTDVVDTDIGGVGAYDLNGATLTLDADGDTDITADTDDQIDIKIAGADDFQFTANTFTAQAGSTIAAQALTATTITASGIVKTDDTTEATSTTDGSLQTDGGLSVAKDAVFGDDVKLLSDSAVLSFGADSDTTLTHTDGTGLTLNSTSKLCFQDTGTFIYSNADGDLDLSSDGTNDNSIKLESAGGVTIDANNTGSAGIIVLDAQYGGIVSFRDGGSAFGQILNSGSDFIVKSTTSDKDLILQGSDGGVGITAAKFDMSAGGVLTLGGGVDGIDYSITFDGNAADGVLTWMEDEDYFQYSDDILMATDEKVQFRDTGLYISSNADGDLDVVSDGTAVDSINLESAGGITLDAGTAASGIIYEDDGTEMLRIHNSSSDVIVEAKVQDKDIIFKGDDGGSAVTALTLDMSAGGIATFGAAANVAQQAVTSSSNAVAWDASDKPNAYHQTTENTTFSAPSNAVEGAFICIEINYNGSHTIAWNTIFEFAASTEPTTTDTDAKTDILVFRYNGAIWQEVGRTLNLSES